MPDYRINFNYNRKDELQKAVDDLKKRGHRSVTMTMILEVLLDNYLDKRHDEAKETKTLREYLDKL